MRFVLRPVFGALVKFVMALKLSLWVRSVPLAVLLLLATMAVIPLVCGLTLSGFGPIWHAATMMAALSPGMRPCPLWDRPNLVCCDAFDADGLRSPVRERPCFWPVKKLWTCVRGGCCSVRFVPDLKGNSSRACVCLSADRVCSLVGSVGMCHSGMWNLPAAIACAFCFQSILAAMLAACFYVPGLLFKGMNKDECKKRKISSSFLSGQDLLQASCLIRGGGAFCACMRRAGGRT